MEKHRPLRHATDQLVKRSTGHSLDDWLLEHQDQPSALQQVLLARDTDDVIIVDRRTIERWTAEATDASK